MGTDIHVFIEKKTDEGWKQVQIDDWLIPANVKLRKHEFISSKIKY